MQLNVGTRKLAIVLQNTSTGGWRYTCRLIEGLKRERPDLQITTFVGRSVRKVCQGQSPEEILGNLGASVKRVPWLVTSRHRNSLRHLAAKAKELATAPSYSRWVSRLDAHDCVLFAWPFGIECPKTKSRKYFIPHDFNYTHFMGSFVGNPSDASFLREQHQRWLDAAHPIVSTQFIADELHNTFPAYAGTPKIIPLSHLGEKQKLTPDDEQQILARHGIQGEYVLSLNNSSPHKNLGQLLSAFHYIAKERPQTKLVIAGSGTHGISGNVNSPYYLDINGANGAVKSLGLVSDREVQALISRAKVVVNSSLYEAGNGSGLDSWALGTPVAMSAIPAFIEHQDFLGVEAQTFNPRCCYEIRDAILRILQSPTDAVAAAERSQQAISRYGWQDVAASYLEYFDASDISQASIRSSPTKQAA